MNHLKKFSFAACFAVALLLTVFSFSEIFAADQTGSGNCATNCQSNKQACYNINPDRRLCEEEYRICMDACKPTNSESQQEESSTAPAPKKY